MHLRYHSFLQHASFLAVAAYTSAYLINVVLIAVCVNPEVRKPFQKDLYFQVRQKSLYCCFLQLIVNEQ